MTGPEIRDVSKLFDHCEHLFDTDVSQTLDLVSIKTHHWKIWSCSAVTGEHIVEGIDWVVNDIAERLYYSSTASAAASSTPLRPLAAS